MTDKPTQEEIDRHYENYSWWGCPRCSSESINEYSTERFIDGVFVGYQVVWQCGDCLHEFTEPEPYGVEQ